MSEKIQVLGVEVDNYTAKEAMQQVVTYMKSESLRVIEIITVEKLLKETESRLFVKLFMQYLHKNRGKVFLLAQDEKGLMGLRRHMEEEYGKIRIVDAATMEGQGVSDDMIVNLINGVEADCIIAALPSPLQEEFVIRHRPVLNARIWLGLGIHLSEQKKKNGFRRIKNYFVRQFIKREMENVRKN